MFLSKLYGLWFCQAKEHETVASHFNSDILFDSFFYSQHCGLDVCPPESIYKSLVLRCLCLGEGRWVLWTSQGCALIVLVLLRAFHIVKAPVLLLVNSFKNKSESRMSWCYRIVIQVYRQRSSFGRYSQWYEKVGLLGVKCLSTLVIEKLESMYMFIIRRAGKCGMCAFLWSYMLF